MEKKLSNTRTKIYALTLEKDLDPFSIYVISFLYNSGGNFKADAVLTIKGRKLASQFSCKFNLLPGTNKKTSFSITTDSYMPPQQNDIYLHINSVDPDGFTSYGPLTNAVTPRESLDKQFEVNLNSIKIEKLFDLRIHLANPKYSVLDVKKAESLKEKPPIILHGYYLKEDGLGAHMPNLFEHVFYDYKNVAFNRQLNRHQLHFSFLNQIKNFDDKTLDKYSHDFKWMRYYYSREGIFRTNPKLYKNCKFLHVGGFDLNTWDLYRDAKMVEDLKAKLNADTYIYLMWESTGLKKIEGILNAFDNVIVTNTWLKNLIKKELGHKNVHRVEHIAKYYDVPSDGAGETFNFGYSGGLWERKGIDRIIKAYNQAKGSKTKLRIHSRDFVNLPHMLKAVEDVIKISPDTIELQNKTLSNEEYASWWNTLNCFVFISAGESYSIQPRQALMQGIPVILSKNTAHLDLLDIPGILWVETEERKGAEFSGQPGQEFDVGTQFIASIDNTVEQMKKVMENYNYWKKEAQKGGAIIRKKVNPVNIKKQWEAILNKSV